MTALPDGQRWNHNIHYQRLVLDAIPQGAEHALDVGCGEGMLCRALRNRVRHVVGIDADPGGIELARTHPSDIEYLLADFQAYTFEPESFDLIASIATLHHLDERAALQRMAQLLRPGGVLAVIGVARRSLRDLPYDTVGFFAHRAYRLRKGLWQHPSPIVWPPPHTYPEIRRLANRLLPGVRCRRHVLFRYSLIWTKPL